MKRKYTVLSNIIYALKNIWRWNRGFYLYVSLLIPCNIALPLAGAYFPKVMIEAIEKRQKIKGVILSICLYFAVVAVVDLLSGFCNSRLEMRRYSLSCLYQNEISKKFMRTDFSNTDDPNVNMRYSLAMNDACSGRCAPEFIWVPLLALLSSFVGIVTYGGLIIKISPVLLAALLLSVAVTYFISVFHRKYYEKNKEEWTAIDRKISYLSSFSHRFEYAKDIRLYRMSGWIEKLMASLQKERFVWQNRISFRSFAGVCINGFFVLITEGLTYGILIMMLLGREISAGDFVFYFGVIAGFSSWIKGIAENVNDIQDKGTKIGYYREYFKLKEHYNHGAGCPLPTDSELPVEIEFCNVSYQYASDGKEKFALKDITLRIKRGEKIALVGENGAGKTTFVKLLCGLYIPTEGVIRVNGRAVSEYNIEQYYTMISAVFQDIYLLPVTIAEFVASGEWKKELIDHGRVWEALKKAGLDEKIRSLPRGIDSRLMKGVFDDSIDLSGGEKQKLMLARALYKDGAINVLDEPTAALDPIAEHTLYQRYHEMTKDKTSVFISHRLASTRFCDRIILLEQGQIVEIGSHDELMRQNGKYAQMFEIQSHYYRGQENVC